MIKEYNWETWYDAANNLMCHKFSERIIIRTNINTGLIKIFKDDNEIDRIDGSEMLLTEYESILVRTANEAIMLHNITN